ncbi:DNA-binding protein HU, partial [Halomonas sp. ND22Bw]|uniref:HU family DNA-binding protein n=1 Tax=Halomonas sp. ND22Bw TaxID=2054178 RepID=UPI000D29D6B9
MNMSELIEAIAASADIPKAAASRALAAMVDAVADSLKKGDRGSLVGFGTFTVQERAAR